MSNICTCCGLCFRERDETHLARRQVLRHALASVALVIAAARDEQVLSDLLARGLLKAPEVEFLERLPPFQRATACLLWILRLAEEVVASDKIGWERELEVDCKRAQSGLQMIHFYLNTQLPFAYVHLVTLLVNLNCNVAAVTTGWCAMTAGGVFAGVVCVVKLLIVITLYQGLLSIGYLVHDPFGSDLFVSPLVAYTDYVAETCMAAIVAQQYFTPVPLNDRRPRPDSALEVPNALPAAAAAAAPALGAPEAAPGKSDDMHTPIQSPIATIAQQKQWAAFARRAAETG